MTFTSLSLRVAFMLSSGRLSLVISATIKVNSEVQVAVIKSGEQNVNHRETSTSPERQTTESQRNWIDGWNVTVRSSGVTWSGWGSVIQDHSIIVHERHRWIRDQSGFIGSFDAPWSEWSWITDPDPDHQIFLYNSFVLFSVVPAL